MNGKHNIPEIEAALEDFVADREPWIILGNPPLDLRALAGELRLLPAMLDMGGCYGLRLNGEVVSFVWDELRQLRVEHDERIRNMVMFRASLKYAQLVCLVPQKPVAGVTCPHCGGSGIPSGLPVDLARKVVCFCGGLGWLPVATS
jgi:hypothetical protein